MDNKEMIIHATNITGLGASQVVTSFIDSCDKLGYLHTSTLFLPNVGALANFQIPKVKVERYNRYLPNSISRIIECLFSMYLFPKDELTITLGDIPLRGISNQIVLVHQPNLIKPRINPYSSKSIKHRINRLLFEINLRYTKKIVVQTDVMADELVRSYPQIKNRISIIPQPLPSNFSQAVKTKKTQRDRLTFFYPAASYPHKNHRFITTINEYCTNNKIDTNDFEIWLTLSDKEYKPYQNITFLKNLGRLNYSDVIKTYNNSDALLFLSHSESYGIPLIEAMKMSVPILVPNLSYAQWMCQDKAYYFEHNSAASFIEAKNYMKKNLINGISHDYNEELQKFPSSWDDVVEKFLE